MSKLFFFKKVIVDLTKYLGEIHIELDSTG